MMRPTSASALAMIVGLTMWMSAGASAAVVVLTSNGQVLENAINPETGKWRLRLHATDSGQPTFFDIRGTGSERIESIVVLANNVGQTTQLLIGGPNEPGSVRSVDLIERDEETIQDVWIETLRVREDVGDVRVTTIVDAIVGRDLIGTVEMLPRLFGANSKILSLIVRGDALGEVLNPYGEVIEIRVDGAIGTPEARPDWRIRDNLIHLVAGEIHGRIYCGDYGGEGVAGRIETTTSAGRSGALTGLVSTRVFAGATAEPGLFLEGPLEGYVSIQEGLNWGLAEIVVPQGGLQGQVLINAGFSGQGWIDPVKIGADGAPNQIVLDKVAYTVTAAEIGGGAVGLAPFRRHAESCDPPWGGEVASSGQFLTEPAKMRHYGPVLWEEGFAPVHIKRRPAGTAEAFGPVSVGQFTFDQTDAREVEIHPAGPGVGFEVGYEYEITPMRTGPGALRCGAVVGNPLTGNNDPAHTGYRYFFTVVDGACPADLDGSGDIGATDLAQLLGGWGVCTGACAADLNGDGAVGPADLSLLLGGWGACGG